MGSVPAVSPPDSPPAWWQRGAIYQIYPRSFADADGDGVGDLRGVIAHLDHLERRSGSRRSGCRRSTPRRWPTSATTSPTTATSTRCSARWRTSTSSSREAHARGIRVVIDWVPNHTSDQHPWFAGLALEPRRPQARLVRLARRPAPRRRAAEQLGSAFAAVGRGLDFDERDRAVVPALVPAPSSPTSTGTTRRSRRRCTTSLRFWLDRGVDGFRIDVVHTIAKDPRAARPVPARPRATTRTGADDPRAPAADPPRGRRVRRPHARRRGLPPRPRPRRRLRQRRRRAAPRPQLRVREAAVGRRRLPRRASTGSRRWPSDRLAGLVPRQPRPPARRLPLRRRRPGAGARAGGRLHALRAARHAVRLPGRGARACPTPRSRRSAWSTSTAATPSARPSRGSRRRRPARAPGSPPASRGCRSSPRPSSYASRARPPTPLDAVARAAAGGAARGRAALQTGSQRTLDAGAGCWRGCARATAGGGWRR